MPHHPFHWSSGHSPRIGPEHVAPKNPRPDAGHAAHREIIVDARRAVRAANHRLKRARRKKPPGSATPPTPSGFCGSCRGPAPKPSRETEKQLTRSLDPGDGVFMGMKGIGPRESHNLPTHDRRRCGPVTKNFFGRAPNELRPWMGLLGIPPAIRTRSRIPDFDFRGVRGQTAGSASNLRGKPVVGRRNELKRPISPASSETTLRASWADSRPAHHF